MDLYKYKNNEKTQKEKRLGYNTCLTELKVFLNVMNMITLYDNMEYVITSQ